MLQNIFFRGKLSNKILILFLSIAFIPFTLINWYLYSQAQATVQKNVEQSLNIATVQGTDTVNNFINYKLLGLLSHSQGAALLTTDKQLIEEDLLNFLLQDSDIISLTYVDPAGQELVKVDRNKIYPEESLRNIKDTDEFKIASFKFSKEYISPAKFNNDGTAEITISTPILYPKYSTSLSKISSVQEIPRTPDEIFGILIERVSLEKLQDDISSIEIGSTGYMYLVDHTGKVIAHKDDTLIGTLPENHENTEVQRFLTTFTLGQVPATPIPRSGVSFNKVPVLSAHGIIPRTRRAVISEQRQDEVLLGINQIKNQALFLLVLSLLAATALSIFFARSLTSPVEKLVEASAHIGRGDFNYNIAIKTGDELEHLASAFKEMAHRLSIGQNALIAEKNTLSTVINNTADGVVGLDQDFKIVLFNKAFHQIADLTNINLINQQFDSVVSMECEEKPVTIKEYCSDITATFHKVNITINGKSKHVNLAIATVPTTISSRVRHIITLIDMTKEQELETMKMDFVSMAAHELRTPLTIIQGYLALFISENKDGLNDQQKSILNNINTASDHLVSLVESLLNASHIERGGFSLNPTEIQWETLVKETLKNLDHKIIESKIKVKLDKHHAVIPTFKGDKQLLTQVLVNLISNAVKYSEPNKEVSISFDSDADGVTTYIKDQGLGIPKEAIPKLFSKFYRVPGRLEQTARGTGLGLYICRKIIELHGGKIWVDSNEGEGSTFAFTIPFSLEKP